jgi:hypothetical protein
MPLLGNGLILSTSSLNYTPVVTGMDYGLDGRDSIPKKGKKCSLFQTVQTGSWAHSVTFPMDTWGSFSTVKWSGLETDHSLPPSVEAKTRAAIPPISHMTSWLDV